MTNMKYKSTYLLQRNIFLYSILTSEKIVEIRRIHLQHLTSKFTDVEYMQFSKHSVVIKPLSVWLADTSLASLNFFSKMLN